MTLTVEQCVTSKPQRKSKPHNNLKIPVFMKSIEIIEAERKQYEMAKEYEALMEKGKSDARQGLPYYIDESGLSCIGNTLRNKQKVKGTRKTEEGGTQTTKAYFSKDSAFYAAGGLTSGVPYYLTSDIVDNSNVQGYNSKCAANTTKKLSGTPTVNENGVKTYENGTTVSIDENGYEVTIYPDGSEKYERVFGKNEKIFIDNTAFEVEGLKITAIYDENGNMISREIK